MSKSGYHLADAKMGVLASIVDVTHSFDRFPAERANISRRAWEASQRIGTRYVVVRDEKNIEPSISQL